MPDREPSGRFRLEQVEDTPGPSRAIGSNGNGNGGNMKMALVIISSLIGLSGGGIGIAHRMEGEERTLPPWVHEKLSKQDREIEALKEKAQALEAGRAGDRGEILTELRNINKRLDKLDDRLEHRGR